MVVLRWKGDLVDSNRIWFFSDGRAEVRPHSDDLQLSNVGLGDL